MQDWPALLSINADFSQKITYSLSNIFFSERSLKVLFSMKSIMLI